MLSPKHMTTPKFLMRTTWRSWAQKAQAWITIALCLIRQKRFCRNPLFIKKAPARLVWIHTAIAFNHRKIVHPFLFSKNSAASDATIVIQLYPLHLFLLNWVKIVSYARCIARVWKPGSRYELRLLNKISFSYRRIFLYMWVITNDDDMGQKR